MGDTLKEKLTNMGFEKQIVNDTCKLFSETNKRIGCNSKNTNKILYDCCYKAHIANTIIIDAVALGKKFGLARNLSCIAHENMYVYPSFYVDLIMTKITEILYISNELMENINELTLLIDDNPPAFTAQTVAMALINTKIDRGLWMEESNKIMSELSISEKNLTKCTKKIMLSTAGDR